MRHALLIAAGLAGTLLSGPVLAGDGDDRPSSLLMPSHAYLLQGEDAARYLDQAGAPQGSGAQVIQQGHDNAAAARQSGPNNDLLIHQIGNGHTGAVHQVGSGQRFGLIQFGRNTSPHGIRLGNNPNTVLIMRGW